jgi:hypothetical protein
MNSWTYVTECDKIIFFLSLTQIRNENEIIYSLGIIKNYGNCVCQQLIIAISHNSNEKENCFREFLFISEFHFDLPSEKADEWN